MQNKGCSLKGETNYLKNYKKDEKIKMQKKIQLLIIAVSRYCKASLPVTPVAPLLPLKPRVPLAPVNPVAPVNPN